ncbi:MAG TPA: CcoQ/FixQ family Cbb3-type cytochrome c oxidase assembly chaperone [Longimicrobiales bacterium]|nr:CcoQ/FixQ family Cbb3-type cytochrome c oxidase assembly chaperone [Longimicrobiales bacterium]
MNPLYNQAADTVLGGWLMGIMTGVFLLFFVGWTVWAYHPGRKDDMHRASMMPFEEGDES